MKDSDRINQSIDERKDSDRINQPIDERKDKDRINQSVNEMKDRINQSIDERKDRDRINQSITGYTEHEEKGFGQPVSSHCLPKQKQNPHAATHVQPSPAPLVSSLME